MQSLQEDDETTAVSFVAIDMIVLKTQSNCKRGIYFHPMRNLCLIASQRFRTFNGMLLEVAV
jgi:hypothetical protein